MGNIKDEEGRWSAYLIKTVTGEIGPKVSLSEGKYSISLNEIEEFSATIMKSDLDRELYKDYLTPWWGGLLFTFDDKAVVAGPIVSISKEFHDKLLVEAQGIRAILAKRFFVEEMTDTDYDNKLSKSVIQYRGLSLGTIAQTVVRYSSEAKPGAMLPITYPIRREVQTTTALNQRTYKGFNINNLSVDDILTKLSNVRNGPDVMFRPVKKKNLVVWEMHHGTKNDYRIAQKTTPLWDLTVEGQANTIELIISGDSVADRVFAVGGGTDSGTVMAASTSTERIKKGFPFLEKTISSGNSDNKDNVKSHAVASRQQSGDNKIEFSFNAYAWGGPAESKLGNFFVGDLVKVHSKGYWFVKDGTNDFRLLNINGSYGSGTVSMSLQLNSQWDNLSKEELDEDQIEDKDKKS